jgi:hypothetical protein
MRPLRSLRPELPPPPRRGWLATGVTIATAAVCLALFVLVRADVLADVAITLILLVATPITAGIVALVTLERPDRRPGFRAAPPSCDLYTVWPIGLDELGRLLAERSPPPAPRKPGPSPGGLR